MGMNVMATPLESLYWLLCLITGYIKLSVLPFLLGIAVPHFVKRIFPTNNHQQLIPLTVIIGAVFLLFCDVLTALLSSEIMLPINVATAPLAPRHHLIMFAHGKSSLMVSLKTDTPLSTHPTFRLGTEKIPCLIIYVYNLKAGELVCFMTRNGIGKSL